MVREWDGGRRFNSCSGYFRRLFGGRVQKLSVDAGFTCPNRDGSISSGGCTFCDNRAFTPSYCTPAKSIRQQIEEGIGFHRNRYRTAMRYLVYFQSASNTYAPLSRLRELYEEALSHPGVAGIIIGTRPDCVDAGKLDYLASLAREHYVAVEYGIESTRDETLRAINRGHDFACARRAVEQTARRGLHVGAHFILGLPGETEEMMLQQTERINALPLTSVKFHQLQLFRGTAMAAAYESDPSRFRFRSLEEYLDLFIGILRRLRPDLVVERFASEAPPRFRCGPDWGSIRNEQLLSMLEKRLEQLDVYQGDFFLTLHPHSHSGPAAAGAGERTAEKLAGAAEELARMAEELAGAAEEQARTAEELAGAAEVQVRTAEELAGAAEVQARTAEELAGAAEVQARTAEKRTGRDGGKENGRYGTENDGTGNRTDNGTKIIPEHTDRHPLVRKIH